MDMRNSYASHVIASSPLILSFDIRPVSTWLDDMWPILSNKEAIAINQQWAGDVGRLVRRFSPDQANTSASLYLWGLDCDDTLGHFSTDAKSGRLRVRVSAKSSDPLQCLEEDHGQVRVATCNDTDPGQAFRYNASAHELQLTVSARDLRHRHNHALHDSDNVLDWPPVTLRLRCGLIAI